MTLVTMSVVQRGIELSVNYLRYLSKENFHETLNLSYASLNEEFTVILNVRYVYEIYINPTLFFIIFNPLIV